MDHEHKVAVPMAHRVDVGEATKHLLHRLGCDGWYVASHHENVFVFHFTQGGVDRYAVCFECTMPVEKGIYHGSKAWSVSIIPLGSGDDLPAEVVKEITDGLAMLKAGVGGRW